MHVADVRLEDAAAALGGRWRALAASALEPNPFLGPEMLGAAAGRLTARGDELVVVEDAAGLAALVAVRRRRAYRKVPLPALHDELHGHAYLSTPLVRAAGAQEALGALVDHLRAGRRERWLLLETLPAGGPVRSALDAALDARGLRAVTLRAFDRAVLRRRPEPTYLDGRFDARRRKELRRQRRRLAGLLGGEPVTTELAGGAGEDRVAQAIGDFLRLEAAGWKGREGTALASEPVAAAWFAQAMGALGRAGRLRVWALGDGDRHAAMAVGVVAGDTLFHLKVAHDEALARASPGLLLELDLIDAFHDGERAAWLDSCTAEGPSPSARLYPDRRRIETVAIGLDRAGASAARALTAGLAAQRGLQERRVRRGAGAGATPPTS